MEKTSFGSVEKYKMLNVLTREISLMEKNKKEYISYFIHNYINKTIKECEQEVKNQSLKRYFLKLIHNDLNDRIDKHIENKYEPHIVTRLKNYLSARIKVSLNKLK